MLVLLYGVEGDGMDEGVGGWMALRWRVWSLGRRWGRREMGEEMVGDFFRLTYGRGRGWGRCGFGGAA